MVVLAAMRIISLFYIAISNLYVMSPIIPVGKKPEETRKTLPCGGNNFINNVLFYFKTYTWFVLFHIAHICVDFDCISNKYRSS